MAKTKKKPLPKAPKTPEAKKEEPKKEAPKKSVIGSIKPSIIKAVET